MYDIIMKVSELTVISVNDILSRKRTQDICEARQIFFYLSRKLLGKSNVDIAFFVGGRTHQNIAYQMLGFEQHLKIYKGLKHKVEVIEKDILMEYHKEGYI